MAKIVHLAPQCPQRLRRGVKQIAIVTCRSNKEKPFIDPPLGIAYGTDAGDFGRLVAGIQHVKDGLLMRLGPGGAFWRRARKS